MRLAYAAKIVLKSVSGGTDQTIYASTHGGHYNNGTSVVHFAPLLHLGGPLRLEFGRARDAYQVPSRLLFTLDNTRGYYSDYLPNGSDPQYWENASVTLYKADGVADGTALSSMTVEFVGEIVRGTMHFSSQVIEFDVFDIRGKSNKPVLSQKWSQHADYVAGGVGVVAAGEYIPVVLGDWRTGSARLPAKLIAVSGSVYTYAVCNHALAAYSAGNVTDADSNTLTPTSTANWATRGSFQMTGGSGGYVAGEEVYVECHGYSASLTDANHVRLIQFILTQFGGVALANINNDLSEATSNERGSFKVLYDDTGGSSPEYPVRAYVNSVTTLAVNLAAGVAYECNTRIAVVNNEYSLYLETPLVAASVVEIPESRLSQNPLTQFSDPDDEGCTVIRAQYDWDPSTGSHRGNYDSSVEVTSGPIDDQRDRFRNDTTQTVTSADIVLDEVYNHIYDSSAAGRSVQRRLYFRVHMPQVLEGVAFARTQTDEQFDLSLYSDVDIQDGAWDGNIFRVLMLTKDLNTGAVTIRGQALRSLPKVAIWTDASGQDAGGNAVASYWGDSNGLDASGNLVGAWL